MKKLLLVEDNEMNRDMLKRRLERKGFSVNIAGDGEEALLKVDSEQPDLILLDMDLPILNGWETCKRLKANPQTQSIPIIALTAHAMAEDEQKAFDVGCDDYATKPFDFPILVAKINSFLS